MEEYSGVVDLARGDDIGGGGQRFNALREADLLGGEVDYVKTKE